MCTLQLFGSFLLCILIDREHVLRVVQSVRGSSSVLRRKLKVHVLFTDVRLMSGCLTKSPPDVPTCMYAFAGA